MIHMWALIVSVIIPLLILGPFFPDLIVSLSSMFFLVYVLRNKMFFYFNNKPLIIFFVFCVYCILVSIFFANDFSNFSAYRPVVSQKSREESTSSSNS